MCYDYTMEYSSTISELIMSHLLSARSSHRQKKILWEMVHKRVKTSKENYRQNLHRLSKKGYIEKKDDGYLLTAHGKATFRDPHRPIHVRNRKDKKIVIIFDIPEQKKKTREWLRSQIKWWGFKMIQKSVWIGHGPLPTDFKKRLKDLGIENSVLMFAIKTEKLLF